MEQAESKTQELQLEFTGNGRDYFGIWIVNILLTIITLGIYTAWAKVRTRKYFYNNTRLDGTSFDYHAKPVAILKGWAIVAAVLIVQQVLMNTYPLYGLLMILVIIAFIPWAIVRSRVFNLLNTSYRNVRFYFEREYKPLYKIYLLVPLMIVFGYIVLFYASYLAKVYEKEPDSSLVFLSALLIFTGILLIPYYIQRFYQFIISRSSYGGSRFENRSSTRSFYAIYMTAALLGILLAGFNIALAYMSVNLLEVADGMLAGVLTIVSTLVYAIGIYYIIYYIESAKLNEIWGKTSIEGHQFVSKLTAGSYAWLMLSNTILIVITLGIYIPWAKVRLTRYRLEHMHLQVNGDLDSFIARKREEMGALGSELGDALDIEISL